MTNKYLLENWTNLSLELNDGKKYKLSEVFMVCWGETDMNIGGLDKKILVFDCGGPQGAPALFCHSDEENDCWECVLNKDGKYEEQKIGKFLTS
jgi:hypothetical protein